MKSYFSVQEAARRRGISVRWENRYALDGRIPGAERLGRSWAIPEDGRCGQTGEAQIRTQAERNVREKQQEGLNR